MSDHERRGDEGLDEEQRQSRETGGDAPAAGSINEREAVAEGEGEDAFPTEGDESGDGRHPDAPGPRGAGDSDSAGRETEGEDEEHEAALPPDEPPG